MPALINLLANVAFGAAMGAVRQRPRQEGYGLSWPLLLLISFQCLVVVPVATFLVRFYPDWSLFYVFDPQVVGVEAYAGPMSLLIAATDVGLAIGAYALTQRATRTEQRHWRWTPTVIASVGAIAVLALCMRRVALVGTYDAYWHGDARWLPLSLPGVVGATTYTAAAGLALWTRRRRNDYPPVL